MVSSYYFYKNTKGEQLPEIDQSQYDKLRENMALALGDKPQKEYRYADSYPQKDVNRKEVTRHKLPFDPNKDSFKGLLKKGVPYNVVKSIVNYRGKGGQYRFKEDLMKLYTIDEDVYLSLEKYILLPSKPLTISDSENRDTLYEPAPKIISPININRATAGELETISGIGPSYARWIMKKRDELGGFYQSEQLLEVYRIEQETIDKIRPFLLFDQKAIRKLDLNTSTYQELARHPYLSFSEAKAIVNYREQHGLFKDSSVLKELYIFKGKNVERLLPYLDLN